jgi:hypothetical protein
VKNPVNEVVFPLCGEWNVNAYAWSKELARLLNVTFQVFHCKADHLLPIQQLLEGDGYYFAHYEHAPPKTNVLYTDGDFSSQLVKHLNIQSRSIVVLGLAQLRSNFYQKLVGLKQHIIILFPDSLLKSSDTCEFQNILRQVAFHQLPLEMFRPESNSILSKFKEGLRRFLLTPKK